MLSRPGTFTRELLHEEVVIALSGRAAEHVFGLRRIVGERASILLKRPSFLCGAIAISGLGENARQRRSEQTSIPQLLFSDERLKRIVSAEPRFALEASLHDYARQPPRRRKPISASLIKSVVRLQAMRSRQSCLLTMMQIPASTLSEPDADTRRSPRVGVTKRQRALSPSTVFSDFAEPLAAVADFAPNRKTRRRFTRGMPFAGEAAEHVRRLRVIRNIRGRVFGGLPFLSIFDRTPAFCPLGISLCGNRRLAPARQTARWASAQSAQIPYRLHLLWIPAPD